MTKGNKIFKRVLSSILCIILVITSFSGLGTGEVVKASTISPLITSYKPQVVNADTNVSYQDGSGNTITGIIHHPGILMSQADLDNMRDHVRAGDEPWNTAFNSYASQGATSKSPRIYYLTGNDLFIHLRGPWAATVDGTYYSNPQDFFEMRAMPDSETCFKQAIMWYITGDEVYRQNAMTIIRDFEGIQSGGGYSSFRTPAMTFNLAAAAEILRYCDTPTESLKWTDNDTANLTRIFDIFVGNYNLHSFYMNQHQFCVMGGLARAIFENDLKLYAEAVEASTVNSSGQQGGRNGSIKYEARYMTANEITGESLNPSDYHVQLMEMGRDAGHSYDDVGGLSTLAQIIDAQGTKVDPESGTMSAAADAVNVFNFLDDRLLAGVTYLLKYHLGYDVLWTPAYENGGNYFSNINSYQRGRFDPFLSILYNHYKYVEQQDMTQEKYRYLAYVYETRMPQNASKDYQTATLLFLGDAAKNEGISNLKTLGTVTGLTAAASGSDTINLKWTAASNALGYNIYRSTDPNGTYTKINSAPVIGTTYSSTGLTPNMIYYYKVGVAGGSTSGAISVATGGSGTPALDSSSYVLTVNHTHSTVLKVTYPDGSSQDLTSRASYTSSDPGVATVDASGVVTGMSAGTSTITATYNGQNYDATVKVVVDPSLITWYQFDETSGTTVADSSGYGNNGTISGESNITWATGKYGNAINFGGSNSTAAYVSLPGNIVDNLSSMTVSAWVYCSNPSDQISLFTAGPAAASSPTKYMMMLLPGSRFTITTGGTSAEQNISSGSTIPANTWKHIAVTLSGNTGIMYIDGTEVARNTNMTVNPSNLALTTSGNFIGKSEWTADKYLKGQVDDFRIYNRALSASEVASVMNGQAVEVALSGPTGVTATTADCSSVNLSWSAVTGATGYNVYASTSAAENAIYTKQNTEVITGTAYTIKGLKANTSYYYRVTAVNAIGESATSATASITTQKDMPDSNLIAWYQFDEESGITAADSSGYGNNGIINGGSNATWTAGKYGNAINFGGSNTTAAYVSLPGNIVDNLNSITVSAWVYCGNPSDQISLFTAGPAAASSPTKYMMMLLPGSRFTITTGGGSAEQNIKTGSTIAANTWKHVAVTLSGNTGIMYIDGTEVARNTNMTVKPSDLAPTGSGNFIGKSEWTADKYLKGQVDDFRIYNRALNAAEITNVMNGQTLVVPTAPNGVSATASGSAINLSWAAVSNATGYNVKRSDVSGGTYTTIATGITDTSYTDTELATGTYYYVVNAVNPPSEGVNSMETSATVLDVPQNLTATGNDQLQATLSWSSVTNATGYNIKRSATSGGPYTTVATGITETSYVDTVPVSGTYYYVVSTFQSSSESENSSEASVTVQPGIFTANQDIGNVGFTGSTVYDGSQYTIQGSGADIWDASDNFQYGYLQVTGDYTITARVNSQTNTNEWAKAGVMFRDSLNANAQNVFLAITPSHGITFQYRTSTGGTSSYKSTGGKTAPYWVKLVRSGNTFTGYISPNGTNWTLLSSTTIAMSNTVYIGLAVTSHDNTKQSIASFDHVTF